MEALLGAFATKAHCYLVNTIFYYDTVKVIQSGSQASHFDKIKTKEGLSFGSPLHRGWVIYKSLMHCLGIRMEKRCRNVCFLKGVIEF